MWRLLNAATAAAAGVRQWLLTGHWFPLRSGRAAPEAGQQGAVFDCSPSEHGAPGSSGLCRRRRQRRRDDLRGGSGTGGEQQPERWLCAGRAAPGWGRGCGEGARQKELKCVWQDNGRSSQAHPRNGAPRRRSGSSYAHDWRAEASPEPAARRGRNRERSAGPRAGECGQPARSGMSLNRQDPAEPAELERVQRRAVELRQAHTPSKTSHRPACAPDRPRVRVSSCGSQARSPERGQGWTLSRPRPARPQELDLLGRCSLQR